MRGALWILVVATSGCMTEVRNFSRSLDGQRQTLQYAPGAASVAGKGPTTLRIGTVSVAGQLPPVTTTRIVERMYLPLLIINYLEETWRCELGRAQIANDLDRFIQETLVEEIQRGSRYALVTERADREVDVTVTGIETSARIKQGLEFVIIPHGSSGGAWLNAGPALSSIEAELTLRAGGEAPRLLKVVGKSLVDVARGEEGRTDLDQVVPALVEGLSLAIQDLNRKIVEAIDAPFESVTRPAP